MIVIGLTGSIGMGKSTAAGILRSMDIPVHEADDTVHALLKPGAPGFVAIQNILPPSLHPDIYKVGVIDRAALGAMVFGNDALREKIESVLHPMVQESQQSFIRLHRGAGRRMAVLDIPLLFETGAERRVDCTIVVSASPDIQRARVLARPGMDEVRFAAILARQMPDAEKRRRADYIVNTGLGLADTRRRLHNILLEIGKEQ